MRTRLRHFAVALQPVLFLAFQSSAVADSRNRESDKKKTSRYLKAAIRAANWMDSLEVRNGDRSLWPVNDEQKSPTEYHLYSGTGGVVLFYLELYRATGEKKYLQTAVRGANKIDDLTKSFTANTSKSFWVGMSGYGYVLAEMYRETSNKEYLAGVERCLKHLESSAKPKNNGIAWGEVTDIIAGTAGTGMWLLYLTDRFPKFRKRSINLAIQAGDGLLSLAKKVPLKNNRLGLNWKMSPTNARNMPNYSHGTAGICDFLAILDQRINTTEEAEEHQTYNGRFLKAAKQGAEYLVSISQRDNKGFVIFHHQPQGENLFYMGWCHGPVGTGRFFRNLATITNDKKWMTFTEAGAQSLIDARLFERRVPGFWNNVGMCCGTAGVGNYFLDLNGMKKSEEYVSQAKKLTNDLLNRATVVEFSKGKTGLKWTHTEHRVKPKFLQSQTGIMQGASGIGLWLLKLHAFENQKKFQTTLPEIVGAR